MQKVKAEVIDKTFLTPRESQILVLICEAAPDKLIARQLAISISTVHAHMDSIYKKLGVREISINSRCAAIASTVARGMVKLSVISA
jgi:DNA-binding NarL/FixJ family response regulator